MAVHFLFELACFRVSGRLIDHGFQLSDLSWAFERSDPGRRHFAKAADITEAFMRLAHFYARRGSVAISNVGSTRFILENFK